MVRYCMTMLALFKPWHSGLDLKVSEQSGDDTFVAHKFSSRQQEVMDYFNLRYECMDAHDDFHAQLKNGNAINPSWNDYAMSGNHADSVGDEVVITVGQDACAVGDAITWIAPVPQTTSTQ